MSEQASESPPDESRDFRARIGKLVARGQGEHALKLLDAALAQDKTASCMLLKGEIVSKLHGPLEAGIYYSGILKNDKVAQPAFDQLSALIQESSLQPEDAAVLAEHLCDQPNSEPRKKALSLLFDGTDEAKREQLLEILGLKSGVIAYELSLATRKANGGQSEEALAILDKARRQGRATSRSDELFANLLAASSRVSRAIFILKRRLETEPDATEAAIRLATLQQWTADFEGLCETIRSSIKRKPRAVDLMEGLANLAVSADCLRQAAGIIAAAADEEALGDASFRSAFASICLCIGEIGGAMSLLGSEPTPDANPLTSALKSALSARPYEFWMGPSRLKDDRRQTVQIVRADNARATLVVMARINFDLVPLNLADALFAEYGLNVIYLRDLRDTVGLNGIAGLGRNEGDAVKALGKMLAELDAPRFIVMGAGFCGYWAARWGKLLDADAAASFAGPTELRTVVQERHASVFARNYPVAHLLGQAPEEALDLVPMLGRPGKTRLFHFYAHDRAEEASQAHRLQELPCATLKPVEGVTDHHVVERMIGDGSFDRLLRELVAA